MSQLYFRTAGRKRNTSFAKGGMVAEICVQRLASVGETFRTKHTGVPCEREVTKKVGIHMRAFFLATTLTVMSYPSVSQACLTLVDETLRTIPADGARNVSVDVAVLVDVSGALAEDAPLPSVLATLRHSNGETLTVSATRVASGKVEIRPAQPLERGAAYELEVRLPSPSEGRVVARTMTFTTTSNPGEIVDAPLSVSLQQWTFAPEVGLSSCSPSPRGTCVVVPDEVVTEVRYLFDRTSQSEATLPVIHQGAFTANLGVTVNDNFRCLQIRQVRSDGTYGEPSVLCADEAPTFELLDNDSLRCTAQGIEHDGALRSQNSGCAVRPPASVARAPRGALAATTLALLIFGLRRRSSPSV